MIHVHIEANSLHDLRKQLRELLDEPEVTMTPVIPPHGDPIPEATKQACLLGNLDAPDQPVEIPTNEDGTPKFRKYQPHSEPAPAPVPDAAELSAEPDVSADPAPAEPMSLPQMADCRAALNALRAKHGPAAVREILTNHGVNSFIDLKDTDYATVMKEAENYGC